MTTKEYLEQYREDVPEWLREFQPGKSRPLADFLKSRIVYYPGSGIDGDPVEVFGASHSAHCFGYADYWLSKEEVTKELHAHGFRGYNVLDEVSFSEREVMSAVHWSKQFLTEEERAAAAKGTATMRSYTHPEPYALLAVLERKPDFGDDHGPERLAILFLGADGIATYEAIFASGNAPQFFGFLLQDHGFGGNYDCFGRGGLLEKIMVRSKVYPHFVLTVYDNPYEGYEKVEWADPLPNRSRCLFYREDMGCLPPNMPEEGDRLMSAEEFLEVEPMTSNTYKIELVKRVPIVEEDGAKWLVDTGCQSSYPDPQVSIGKTMASFLGAPGLRMMGLDRLGIYTLIDYQAGTITCSDAPIPFEGTSVPMMKGTYDRPYVRMSVGGKEVEAYLDTGAAFSYLKGLDMAKWPSAGEKEECDVSGQLWTTDTVVVPASIAGFPFDVEFGDEKKNPMFQMFQMPVDKDAVIGYDFFKSFTVLLNWLEMRLSFKPAGK